MCCLRPGVLGLSENIRVRSLVGRYLEHSRIFYFSEGAGALANPPARVGLSLPAGGRYLLGSADMMERNLDRRSEEIQVRLREILEVVLADDELAWTLSAAGTWEKVPVTKHFNAQRHFQELALSRSKRRGSGERLVEIE